MHTVYTSKQKDSQLVLVSVTYVRNRHPRDTEMLNTAFFVFPNVSFRFLFPLQWFDLVDSKSKRIMRKRKRVFRKCNSIFLLHSVSVIYYRSEVQKE